MKSVVCKDMKEAGCPLLFLDYYIERRAKINNLTAKDPFQLGGRNPHFSVTGEEGDISKLCNLNFMNGATSLTSRQAFTTQEKSLGEYSVMLQGRETR